MIRAVVFHIQVIKYRHRVLVGTLMVLIITTKIYLYSTGKSNFSGALFWVDIIYRFMLTIFPSKMVNYEKSQN